MTALLVALRPAKVLNAAVLGYPRKDVRAIAGIDLQPAARA